MNTKRLEDNLIQTIKEGQMKLGYDPAAVKLNYRLSSLARFLETDWKDAQQMQREMNIFFDEVRPRLGKIEISCQTNGMACLTIPKEGCAYVHQNIADDPFLLSLYALLRKFNVTKEEFLALFEQYGSPVVCEDGDGIEYDFVLYYPQKEEDKNRYCIKLDFGRATYHRLDPTDFALMTANEEKEF